MTTQTTTRPMVRSAPFRRRHDGRVVALFALALTVAGLVAFTAGLFT